MGDTNLAGKMPIFVDCSMSKYVKNGWEIKQNELLRNIVLILIDTLE